MPSTFSTPQLPTKTSSPDPRGRSRLRPDDDDASVRMALVGCGGMARHHLRAILPHFPNTTIPVVCEPSPAAYEATAALFAEYGRPVPRNEPSLARLLRDDGAELDAAFLVTPHAVHHDQAVACLEAGLDVLLEKPMVMTAAEAESLIAAVERSGRLLVVAFDGSLSPAIRAAAALLRSGELGRLLNISATVWQGWDAGTLGTWRQVPAIAGGGFLFDTGAHMLNTVADLAGEPFVDVAAWLDNQGRDVDITGVAMGRLASGALVTFNACGATAPSCASDVRVFCTEGMLRTGVWGRFLEVHGPDDEEMRSLEVPASRGVWQQFLAVRAGQIPNPSPPAVGLRMARLWDAIQSSARQGGRPVPCQIGEEVA